MKERKRKVHLPITTLIRNKYRSSNAMLIGWNGQDGMERVAMSWGDESWNKIHGNEVYGCTGTLAASVSLAWQQLDAKPSDHASSASEP
jgi:hypothetical protein